ncbi:hypothetical protein [Croceicoccus sp. Ery5]|uniref:hypothetical protein n=1 Tax=Croceicoccus sp. Ery5 TaxID=1703340 RepID=UPI001E5921F2|nr:hypothetical protein [Croceicoccus sp. Ery5]
MAKANPQSLFTDDHGGATMDGASPLYQDGEDKGRLDLSFARLDAALSRLERAAVLRPRGDDEQEKLRQENVRLRATVGEALGELDKVLAELDADG